VEDKRIDKRGYDKAKKITNISVYKRKKYLQQNKLVLALILTFIALTCTSIYLESVKTQSSIDKIDQNTNAVTTFSSTQ
jgi:hypothetical protein